MDESAVVMDDERTSAAAHLLPCPFCGGPVKMEEAASTNSWEAGRRRWWRVVFRNTINLGSSCCMSQVPSASKEAAAKRWNMRGGKA